MLVALMCTPPAPATAAANPKYAAIVINAYTGQVLYSANADSRRYPASLTKMMTLYLLFERLERGTLTLQSTMDVSKRAEGQAPSKLGLKAGETITVEQAINALVIKSANDVATVIAETIGGTEFQFAQIMTDKAKALGLTGTHFRNASGLPDRKQYTTAHDMAILGQRLILDFPAYYTYFAATSFNWKGKTYTTHNNLLKRFKGTDGIKTGYIRASGFNLVTSVKRDGYHLIGAVFGGRKPSTRDAHMEKILAEQFARIAIDPSLGRRYVVIPTPMAKPGSEIAFAALTATPAGAMTPVIEEGDTSYTDDYEDESIMASGDPIGDLIAQQDTIKPSEPEPDPIQVASLPPAAPSPTLQARLKDPDAFYGVQIGAYMVRDVAVQRLNAAAARVSDALQNVIMTVVPITVDGRTVYRARIGPYHELEAQNTCLTLQQQGVSCFTIVQEEWSIYAVQ